MRQQAAGCVCPSAEPQVAASCKRRAGVATQHVHGFSSLIRMSDIIYLLRCLSKNCAISSNASFVSGALKSYRN